MSELKFRRIRERNPPPTLEVLGESRAGKIWAGGVAQSHKCVPLVLRVVGSCLLLVVGAWFCRTHEKELLERLDSWDEEAGSLPSESRHFLFAILADIRNKM